MSKQRTRESLMADVAHYTTDQKTDAARLVEYLARRGFNTEREIAEDLGMSEGQYNLAVNQIIGYCAGVRRDSYGVYVAWVANGAKVL
jgi:class 3 adenylate cyclase